MEEKMNMASSSCSLSSNEPRSFDELIKRLSSSNNNLSPVMSINQREFESRMRKEDHQTLCEALIHESVSSTHLTHLYVCSGDDDTSRVDSQVVECYIGLLSVTCSLQSLSFHLSQMGGDEAFNMIMNNLHSCKLNITHLGFSYNSTHSVPERIGLKDGLQHLSAILSIPRLPLQSLTLVRLGMEAEGVAILAKSLHTNTTLLSLDLSFNYDIGELGMQKIAEMLLCNTTLQILYLTDMGLSAPLMKHLGIALAQNKTLHTLDISYNDDIGEEGMKLAFPYTSAIKHLKYRCAPRIFKAFANILQHNTSLITLDLWRNRETKPSRVEELFTSIADNRFLQSLDLFACEAVQGAKVASCILDCLQVHSWLTHIDIQDTPLEKEGHVAVIEAQLKRIKEENELGFPQLQKAKPNRIRVFMCGLPGAGKSTLKNSMIRASKGKLHLVLHALSDGRLHFANGPTRGIDIAHIIFPKSIISLWDLAGQEDFYSFHDFMFPDISHVANPSLFLILCKPLDVHESEKALECIHREINYWLRFIGSKSRQSNKFKPIVAIVFTHKDKRHDCSNVSSMRNCVDAIRADFQARLVLSDTVFHLNAKSSISSYKILQYVHKTSSNVLQTWPGTYSSCDQVTRLLNEWKANHPYSPIMRVSEFILLCNNIQELNVTRSPSSSSANALSEEQKLVLQTLTNVGDILYFPDVEYIVVNLAWFCKDLIGKMIQIEGMSSQREELINWQKFVEIVSNSLSHNRDARRDSNVEAQLIVEIMKKMNLCFTRNTTEAPTPDIFIPANLRPALESDISWELQIPNPNPTILGRRLQCLDPKHTTLTPNFFPQIQIAMYNLFAQDNNIEWTIRKDFIQIIDHDYGTEIHLEFHGYGVDDVLDFASQHNIENEHPPVYIDLLMRSTLNRDRALKRLHIIAIKVIRELCANWKGCQGVTLIEGILRPDCVQQPGTYKMKQCVLISTLRDKLMKFRDSEIHYHQYVWNEFGSLTRRADSTKELLGEEAFMDVISERVTKVIPIAVELIRAEMRDESDRLQRLEDMLNTALQTLEEISKNLKCTEEKVQHELKEIAAVLDIVNAQGDSLQHEIPHLFYFTQRSGTMCERVGKLMASINFYKLRFFCEGVPLSSSSPSSSTAIRHQRHNHHEVEDKYEGLSLVFAKSNRLQKAMPYLNRVLKVVTFLAKVSAHVVAGAGELVPDLAKLPALVFDTAVIDVATMKLQELVGPEMLGKDENKGPEQWLVDILIENNCCSGKAIGDTFGLYRVKHKRTSKVAWVCEAHRDLSEFESHPLVLLTN